MKDILSCRNRNTCLGGFLDGGGACEYVGRAKVDEFESSAVPNEVIRFDVAMNNVASMKFLDGFDHFSPQQGDGIGLCWTSIHLLLDTMLG